VAPAALEIFQGAGNRPLISLSHGVILTRMKRLIIPVCFAATAVLASDLKDPSTVARDWQRAVDQARRPIGSSGNLAAQSDDLTTTPLERLFSTDVSDQTPALPARPPLLDAPSYQVPKTLPSVRPRGAMPWEYNGEVYWLVPLNSPARK